MIALAKMEAEPEQTVVVYTLKQNIGVKAICDMEIWSRPLEEFSEEGRFVLIDYR